MCELPPTHTRRQVLRTLGLGATGVALAPALLLPGDSLAESTNAGAPLLPTPKQIEGPYYPPVELREQLGGAFAGNDLTELPKAPAAALGTRLYLAGRVLNTSGRPIPGATIEIWQACLSGRYIHPGDRRRSRPHDPNFQFWGLYITDVEGRYAFKTILPPAYPSGAPFWTRPPHIHVRASTAEGAERITQIYFDDPNDPANAKRYLRLNQRDLLLRGLPRSERGRLIRTLDLCGAAHNELLEPCDLRYARGPAADRWDEPRFAHFDMHLAD